MAGAARCRYVAVAAAGDGAVGDGEIGLEVCR